MEVQDFDGANDFFDRGFAIAEVNYGNDHIGVLFGRYLQGRLWVREKRWSEARDILIEVTERQKECLQGWGRFHYDRFGSLVELAEAHNILGEYDACGEADAESLLGFEKTTTSEHPRARKLRIEATRWKRERPPTALT